MTPVKTDMTQREWMHRDDFKSGIINMLLVLVAFSIAGNIFAVWLANGGRL